jgi:transposase
MAAKTIMPNGENCSLLELETAAHAAPKQKAFRRLWCMRALLLGPFTKADVCSLFAVNLNTLNGWIRRFNASGIDGLLDKSRPGRPRKIAPDKTAQYRQLIDQPARVEVTHWTGKKFHGYLTEQLQVQVGYRTVIRWLHEVNYALKVPRPWPDRQDQALRQAFQLRLKQWLIDQHIELWYLDECGVEGDPRPRRRWAQKGAKTTVTRNGDHVRMNVTGMICPRTGVFYGLEFSHSDTEVFQCFLDHANTDVQRQRPRNLLIMDNASWHKSKSLKFGAFEPVYLPPYSPDYNPIERLWLILKAEWFSDFIAKDRDALIARLDDALNWLIARTDQNKVTAAIR